MTDPIYPPLPINIPGNVGNVTTSSGTGLSYFVPPTAIPGETPPNTQVLPFEGIVTQNLVPGLVPVVFVPQQGPPATFLPTQLAGLVAWYRADLGITFGAGTSVSAWADQSGTGDINKNLTQATLAKQPTFNAFDIVYNGRPTLSFAGVQGLLSAAWLIGPPPFMTTFSAGNDNGLSVGQQRYVDTAPINSGTVFANAVSSYSMYDGTGEPTGGTASAAPRILVGLFNGASSALYSSARTPVATGVMGAPVRTGLGVGLGTDNSSDPLEGKLAETIVYGRGLSQFEINQVLAYLGTRYAIAIGA